MIDDFCESIVKRPKNFFIVSFGSGDHIFPTIRAKVHVVFSEDFKPTLCADEKLQFGLEKILEIKEEDNCTVFPINEKSIYYKMEEVKVEFGYSKSILFSKNVKEEGPQIIGISAYNPGIISNVIWQGILYRGIEGLKYS